MLGRYQIIRGRRPPERPLPSGVRQDTRKHTRHILRPEAQHVQRYLSAPDDAAWRVFSANYRATLAARYAEQRGDFDALAALAEREAVWLGCNCPTRANPDVRRCHTYLALSFLAEKYPELEVHWPDPAGS